ncbi:MAG: P-II family nitrogen regulator [Pseudomonadota bacterium]
MTSEKSMLFRKVTAIIRGDALEKVEQRLQELGVSGISVTRVKGYGGYKNFYSRDWMTTHARVEIFIPARRADEIAQAIMDAAYSGVAGDGIVVVLPVEKIYKIRQRAEVPPDDL